MRGRDAGDDYVDEAALEEIWSVAAVAGRGGEMKGKGKLQCSERSCRMREFRD